MKRYVHETGTDLVLRLLSENPAAVSRLSEAEVSSALSRRTRAGDLRADERALAVQALRSDLRSLEVVELAPEVVTRVHDLLSRHTLNAADALQLASALALRREGDPTFEFVCWDDRLRNAARAEGFVIVPSED